MTLGWADGDIHWGITDANWTPRRHDRVALGDRGEWQLFRKPRATATGLFPCRHASGAILRSPPNGIFHRLYDFRHHGPQSTYTARYCRDPVWLLSAKDYKTRGQRCTSKAGLMCLPTKDVRRIRPCPAPPWGRPIFGMDATRISMGGLLTLSVRGHENASDGKTRTELILRATHHWYSRRGRRSLKPAYQHLEVSNPIVTGFTS